MAKSGAAKKIGLGAVVAAAGAVAAFARRREDGGGASAGPAGGALTCRCGRQYRTTGEGRHRVIWPAEASATDPVLDGNCVGCGKPLAAEAA